MLRPRWSSFNGHIATFWKSCCLTVLFVSLAGRAQTFSGAVVGRVVDTQRSAIPNARVNLSSSDRGYERSATTNVQGEYLFPVVPPGRYTLQADAKGFAVTTVTVEVVVATTVRADLTLGIQRVRQVVNVVGESGVAVQTENANLGRTISPHEMSELPTLTRGPYDFIALMPGATLSNDLLGVGYAVNGSRTQSANYLLDGSENNDTFMSAPAQDVPLDSIEEFSVQTNHYSSEYGRNSGFTANIVTKAGTNYFHGSLYEYVRNSGLAANTYDNNAHGFPRPVFNRNQFGGTLGGPIKPTKLFFFVSLEPILVRSNTTNSFYVPTPQLLGMSAPGTQDIFQQFPLPPNLSSTDVLPETICPFGATCDPQNRAGSVTIPGFALASRLGPQDVGAGLPQNTTLATGRLDWVINPKMLVFVRYAVEDQHVFATVTQPYSRELDVPQSGRNQNIALNLVGTWSPRMVTESRIAYSRVAGVAERFGGNAPAILFPSFSIQSEPATLPSGDGVFDGLASFYQIYQSITFSRGHHLLKLGGQFVQLRDKHTYGIGQTGDGVFLNTQEFVDGVLHSYEIALNPRGHSPGELLAPPFGPPSFTRHFRYNKPALFIDETWKITPRLSLTPGLRWEYFGVPHSPGAEHPLDSNFYLGPGNNELEQIANGRFLRTVDAPGGLRGRFYLPDYRNFAPRLGIAYDLLGDGKTVIRAGIGVFYDNRVGWELFRVFLNPPTYSLAQLASVPVTPELLADQYVAFPNVPLRLSQSDSKPIDTHLRSSYTTSWNATIEREVLGRFVAGVSYLGASGSRLYSIANQSRIGSGGLLDPSCVTTRLAADGVTPLGPDYTNCPGLNPDVSAINTRANGDHSSYAALQLRIDSRRFPHWGIEFGANYTWSHSIDNGSVSGVSGFAGNSGGHLAAFEPGLDRGPSDFDIRHRFAAHWIWEIPVGRNSNDWKGRYMFGGWEVSGLLSYQTGQPFTINDSGVPDISFTGLGTRPRLTGPLPRVAPLIPDAVSPNSFLYLPMNQVYDASDTCIPRTAPFACEISVNGPFDGTLSRNAFRQPGTFFQDTALLKNIPLPKEGMKLQLRFEFYNLLNHSNLYMNAGTNDVNASSFVTSDGQRVPGVTASFRDNRQIVVALKLVF